MATKFFAICGAMTYEYRKDMNLADIKISAAMSVYNGERFLAQAIESIQMHEPVRALRLAKTLARR